MLNYRDHIVRSLSAHRRLVISAPPGTGKSTQVPRFFLDSDIKGKIMVLQPRRIAARSLAAFVSKELGEKTGQTVGYQVRFDTCAGKNTKIVFQTYGVFLRQLLSNPNADGVGLVILDEFHERTIETDLTIAWLKRLSVEKDSAVPFIVMSATLQTEALSVYLDKAPVIKVDAKAYPVTIAHQTPQARERIPDQAVRALKKCLADDPEGSVLIFMPGAGEIRRTMQLAGPICKKHNRSLRELYGGLPLPKQTAVLDDARGIPCVIVSTNVAETSLTIPGITAVIDSGLERRAGYDHEQDRNTLYLKTISLGSAVQRSGRAGRTAPGSAIRLWAKDREPFMEKAVPPDMERLELSWTMLAAMGLLAKAGLEPEKENVLSWLSSPPVDRWNHAREILEDIEAVKDGRIISLGKNLLTLPAQPLPARLIKAGEENGLGLLSAAVIALWDTADRSSKNRDSMNLFTTGRELVLEPNDKQFAAETRTAFDQLCKHLDKDVIRKETDALAAVKTKDEKQRLLKNLADCWIKPLRRRIAVLEEGGNRYSFADGKPAEIAQREGAGKIKAEAVLALTVLETGGAAQGRKATIVHYIPVEPRWIAEALKDFTVSESLMRWNDKKKSVTAEVRTIYKSLVLLRTSMPGAKADPQTTAELLAQKLLSGDIDITDDMSMQFIYRMRCAASAFPDRGFTPYNDDDMKLLYHDLAEGKSSASDFKKGSLLSALKSYAGSMAAGQLDRLVPTKTKLSSGRMAKITYMEKEPPEISARIADFIGWKGSFSVGEGRIKGIFNILAPSLRTVQKTANLDGFWGGSYLQIKAELKRRYPKHKWP